MAEMGMGRLGPGWDSPEASLPATTEPWVTLSVGASFPMPGRLPYYTVGDVGCSKTVSPRFADCCSASVGISHTERAGYIYCWWVR